MNLLTRLQRLRCPATPATWTAAMPTALPVADPAEPAEPPEPAACGWFDSSHALRQGLEVTEWPEADGPVAALYFLDRVGPRSAALQ